MRRRPARRRARDTDKSRLPFLWLGVPTQSSDTSVSRTAAAVSVVALSRPLATCSRQQFVKARLDNRAPALVDRRHLVGVDVDADHVMTVAGKRRGRHAANVPRPKTETLMTTGPPCEIGVVSGTASRRRGSRPASARKRLHALAIDERAMPELEVQQAPDRSPPSVRPSA